MDPLDSCVSDLEHLAAQRLDGQIRNDARQSVNNYAVPWMKNLTFHSLCP